MKEGDLVTNRYRLLRTIGKGAMGTVWLAQDTSTGLEVALKLIDAKFANEAEARARFLREALLAARISSAHVAKILDHGVTSNDRSFIVMDRLIGTNLR